MDILQDIRGMVQKAIDDGITFEQFRKELEPKLKAKGYWGKKMVGDETGTMQVQLALRKGLRLFIKQTSRRHTWQAGIKR